MNPIRKFVRPATLAVLVSAAIPSLQAQTRQPAPAEQPNKFVGGGSNTFVGGVNPHPWFANPQVSEYLQLNNQQTGQLYKAYQDAWANYYQGINSMDKGLTEAQRQQRMQELQQNFYREFGGASDNFLKDRDQRARYKQLYLQYRSYGAFGDPFVYGSLNLTPAQREKLNGFHQDWAREMNNLEPLFRSNQAEAAQQFNKLQAQYSSRVNSVLTPQQQTSWQQMSGSAYNFGPGAYFGPNNNAPANTNKAPR